MMVGPNDLGPSPAGQVLRRLLGGEMPVVLPGNLVVVDARDVASAVLAAVTRGVSGDRFIVGGRAISFLELATVVEAASGVPMPRRRPPYPLARAMLTLASIAGRVSGQTVPVSPADLRRMRNLRAPDSSKARAVLGVEFRPLTDTLRDTVAWIRADSARRVSTMASGTAQP
jgi:dihydroflavonol-4-reductase